MFEEIRNFFKKAWDWIQALWDKHDEHLQQIVQSILPMVIDVALRKDLSGEEKRKTIVNVIVNNSEQEASDIAVSMLNEAIEIAANKYNIQIGKLTREKIDNALNAATKAGKDYIDKKLNLDNNIELKETEILTNVPESE